MDASSLEELVFDPSKNSKLSMEEKRDLVYEVSNWSDDTVTEMLQSWSRQEILQILCAELGKERKYTGLTKSELIERLLRIISEKKSEEQSSSDNDERTPKRQRKFDLLNCLPVAAISTPNGDLVCKNSACKAKMNGEDSFCKRCSCCICRKYDDNKDPSLWLICNSEPPFHGPSCGMSCHLECALRHENSGISMDRQDKGLDGSFCCVSCGKVNDLLGSWRKQLVVARDTRRVDIFCYRLSLGQKILSGTKHYQNLNSVVNEAVKMLEEDVGPLTGVPVKMTRGIVNRLSSGPEIQKLCASAVESLDLILSSRVFDTPSDCNTLAAKLVRFEDIRASSLAVILNSNDINIGNVVGYSLWHRKAEDTDYPSEPTCRLFQPNMKFILSGLTPATKYFLKVVTFDTDREMGFCEFQFQTRNYQGEAINLNSKSSEVENSESPATNCSSLSNPSSVEDETNNVIGGVNYLASFCPTDKASSVNLHGDKINGSDKSQNATNREMDEKNSMEPKSDALNVFSLGKKDTYAPGPSTSTNPRPGPRPKPLHVSNLRNKETSNGQLETPRLTGSECVPYVDRSKLGLTVTPCILENLKGKNVEIASKSDDEPQAGSSSKKRSGETGNGKCTGIGDKNFEYYVKVIRCLECDGHIETEFRQKFLTWYSLRATAQEVRIVKVFIDTFVEDSESLAGQLVDTFSDVVSNKRCSTVPAGFCTKLWH